ncbi:MAG TPA: helicase-associated domain-containing protein [Cellulomonas sp.]
MAISGYLSALDDESLVALLRRRPDLATPSPVTLTSLAARATSRSSLERALTTVDAAVLQAVEAVVALTPDGSPSRERVVAAIAGRGAPGPGAEPAGAPATTLAAERDANEPDAADLALVERALDEAIALALVWPDDDGLHAAPGLAEMLGPYPAGLAPADPREARAVEVPSLTELGAEELGTDARAVLDALTWGPPVGLVPPPGNPAVAAVGQLLDAGLLVRGGPRQVVLPRVVALALRGGRTHRGPARPPVTDLPVRPAAVVDAESAVAAERVVRLVVRLVAEWGQAPPAVLRAGGLGVRDLRALARALDADEPEAAFVVELAGAAGLVADDGEEHPSFAPTDDADGWLRRDLPARWAHLATAWLTSERAPWLVGTRDERGSAHGALAPDLHRRWVPRVRAAVLDVLGSVPSGAAPTLDDVLAVLRWRTPRSAPPTGAAAALLTEAGLLGVTGAGALSPAGRALSHPVAAAAALAASLPTPVDGVLLQGDLTGIVPGRPGDRLAALLERTAVVESRGGALTVRFTPDSIRGALDAGATADELLADLEAAARGGVPQPLEYLIRDAARRHGLLRAGVASSYLRTDDPALLAGLPDDPGMAGLGLRALAPTVLVAAVPPGDLVAALRERGLAPVVEGPDGLVVHAPAASRRTRPRPHREEQPPDDEARLTALVRRLRQADPVPGHPPDSAPERDREAGRTGQDRPVVRRDPGGPSRGTADPAAALLLLREAAAERSLVWVDVVGGRGVLERRLLRPVSVDAGRLRAIDPAREAELVVAVHRIAAAERAS